LQRSGGQEREVSFGLIGSLAIVALAIVASAIVASLPQTQASGAACGRLDEAFFWDPDRVPGKISKARRHQQLRAPSSQRSEEG
jgi:predicted anti-sigma-YlaC factor YlaD